MLLAKDDENYIKQFYKTRLDSYGLYSHGALAWSTKECQFSRFRVFIDHYKKELKRATILDNGSGLGDFFGYLEELNIGIKSYTGVDILPDFVDSSRKKWAKHSKQEFICSNFLEYDPKRKFDYTFASGSLTFYVENCVDFYQLMIKKMWELSNNGVGFNLLKHTGRGFMINYGVYTMYNPYLFLRWCKENITSQATLVQGYDYQDFTIFLDK